MPLGRRLRNWGSKIGMARSIWCDRTVMLPTGVLAATWTLPAATSMGGEPPLKGAVESARTPAPSLDLSRSLHAQRGLPRCAALHVRCGGCRDARRLECVSEDAVNADSRSQSVVVTKRSSRKLWGSRRKSPGCSVPTRSPSS